MESIAVLGVLARVSTEIRDKVAHQLSSYSGVSVFDVSDHQRMGILIEKDTMRAAEDCLRTEVGSTEGILGTWPVFAHFEDADEHQAAGPAAAIRRPSEEVE